jgi:uncharacterized protein (DUF885 family)
MRMPRRAVLGGALGWAMAGRGMTRAMAVPAVPDLRAALDAAAGMAQLEAQPGAALARLAGFDEAALTVTDRLDLRAARAGLAIDAQLAARFPFGRGGGQRPYRVTPFDGAWRGTAPETIEADTRGIEADAAAGVILPRPWLERTIAALRARQAPDEAVSAAIARQAALLVTLLPRSPARQGLGQLPDGERWFTLLCARTLGTVGPLAAVEARLEARRVALHRQAAALFARIGVQGATPGACFRHIWADPAHLYPDDDQGRAQAVADMTREVAAMRARLTLDFGPIPDWCLNPRVRALSPQEIAQGRKGYREVPTPGHPGAYIVDLKAIGLRPRWSLPAVVAHELLPGHMIQLGLEGQNPPHPLRRLYAGSFVESWGIYAERLAAREGAYGDPLTRLGFLHWQLFRVCRGLVDLGMHRHGWSLAEARGRLEVWQGVAAYFAPFDQDLDRIALEPGLRLAEVLGAMAIEDRGGPLSGRGLRAYHQALMQEGSRRTEDLPRPAR